MTQPTRQSDFFRFVLRSICAAILALMLTRVQSGQAQGYFPFPPPPPPAGPPPPVIFCPGFPPLPTNDAFANATVLRGNSVGICGANALIDVFGVVPNWHATAEAGEPPHGGVPAAFSVWYRWTAPASGLAKLKATPLPAIYTGDTLATLVLVSATNSLIGSWGGSDGLQFAAVAGQTYQIAVDTGFQGPFGPIYGVPGQFNLTIQLATMQLAAPEPTTNYLAGQPIEFEFAPLDDAEDIFQLDLIVNGEVIGTRTNAPWRFVCVPTNSGSVAVWAQGLTTSGQFVIAWPTTFTFRPANDDFANATAIADWVSGGTFSADTSTATAEPGEPEPVPGTPAGPTIWWRWVAPYSAETKITLIAGSKLTGFKGESLASLQRVLHLDGSGLVFTIPPTPSPTVSFQAEAGATYYFSAEGGLVSWNLEQRTLEILPASGQRGWVGAPLPLEAVSIETDSPPVQVDFILGQQMWNPWGNTQPYPIGSLGTVTNPPYNGVWIPQQTGTFYFWARSTNSHGVIHQTAPAALQIFAENDDFSRATTMAPEITATNFLFDTAWASAETNEPTHKFGPAANTLWWKWTPSYSGNVRLKAVRNYSGLPLDVYVGNSLENLRVVARNGPNNVSVAGISGIVKLKVKAGQTYYIRTDNDTRGPVAPPQSFPGSYVSPDSVLTIEPASTPLTGELNFSLIVGSYIKNGSLKVIPIARVFQTDRRTPLEGRQYQAQLYVGLAPTSLSPVGEPEPFFPSSSETSVYAGLFYPAPVFVPNTVSHQHVCAQIRVWDSDYGTSFETARGNGSPFGVSNTLRVMTGSEESGGTLLLRMRNFALQEGVPAP